MNNYVKSYLAARHQAFYWLLEVYFHMQSVELGSLFSFFLLVATTLLLVYAFCRQTTAVESLSFRKRMQFVLPLFQSHS